ncbi:MAG: isocitrate lyase/PEP mutase family protein, partial [Nitrospirales bacterium]
MGFEGDNLSGLSKAARLRRLLAARTLAVPGAFNALTAMQIERAGFEAVYVSGAGLANVRGLPDIGLLSQSDVAADAGTIAQAVSLPVLADADTGYGPPLIVRRTVQAFERAGLAGLHLEDQEMPKRCGHLPGKRLIPVEDMMRKLAAAVEARQHPDFLIIARTDARALEGLDGAVRRAQAYVRAGADAVFPEALESAEEFRAFADGLTRDGIK